MSAADRSVPTRVFNKTPDEMEEAVRAQPVEADDVPWTYEVEAFGLSFFQAGVLVERWVQR